MTAIRDLVGLPFVEKGRDRSGLDCWGLVYVASRELYGRELPDWSDEYRAPLDYAELNRLIGVKSSEGDWQEIDVGHEAEGDVIVLRMRGGPAHVGIVVDRGKMLHILEGVESVVEDYRSTTWKSRVLGFHRHVG